MVNVSTLLDGNGCAARAAGGPVFNRASAG